MSANFTKMPPPCRDIGCGGHSCMYYKPIEAFPYYRCLKVGSDEDIQEAKRRQAAYNEEADDD